ncbi:hypothetical protein [Streptomyces sp. NPDC017941]|uniref:hypothetical protein n=1 Tax=Streptomyces sp. NPDC017941 TaxID=3365018 RepID=UPI00378C2D83
MHTDTQTESRHEWAARNADHAAAHPVPHPPRVLGLALATPVVLLLLTLGWYVVALDAELGDASSQAHQDVVARYVLAVLGGVGCLTAGWLTPRGSRAAWLRTAFALMSILVIPVAMLAGA